MSGTLTILLVDDNEMSRRLLAFPLERDKHRVLHAASGEAALDLLATEGADLVFLDLLLEGDMTGFGVLEHLKSTPALSSIPVIVVSGSEERETAVKCLEAGATAFIEKPASATAVRRAVATASDQRPSKAAPPNMPTQSVNLKGVPVLDPHGIEQLQHDYDNTLTAEMIGRFRQLSMVRRSDVTVSAQSGDSERLARAAHDLRGAARTLGLQRLAAACGAVEQQCTAGRLDAAIELVPELDRQFDAATVALTDFVRARRIDE